MLTFLVTSPRVAPGLLSWQAWDILRGASRVLAGSAGHCLVPALTEAGVVAEVVDIGVAAEPEAAAAALARVVSAADGAVAWLMPPGEAVPAPLLSALARISDVPVQVLHGSRDLPGAHLIDVVSIMDKLRLSCPWDREQTHSTLLRYLLEETYEAAEAIEMSDWASLREEIGDVLFQAVFHARVAAERTAADGGFTIDDVADGLAAKLVRRHPHVFGSVSVSSASDVNRNWEEIKKAEKAERAAAAGSGPASALDGVAFGQPALSLAAQLQRRAERAGFPLKAGAASGDAGGESGSAGGETGADSGIATKVRFGAELMRVVARARLAGIDPELALREAARRFTERFHEWDNSRSQE